MEKPTKGERREAKQRQRRKMKVSGASVKTLWRIIVEKAKEASAKQVQKEASHGVSGT